MPQFGISKIIERGSQRRRSKPQLPYVLQVRCTFGRLKIASRKERKKIYEFDGHLIDCWAALFRCVILHKDDRLSDFAFVQ